MAKESVFDQYLSYLTLEKKRDSLLRSRQQAEQQLIQVVRDLRGALAAGNDGLQFRADVEKHDARMKDLDGQIAQFAGEMAQLELVLPTLVLKSLR